MPKSDTSRYRTTNWSEYNASLRQRGSLSIWFNPEMAWHAGRSGKRGHPETFSDSAVQTCLTLKVLFGLPLRQTVGLVASLIEMAGLDWQVPDYSTLCRRQAKIAVQIPYRCSGRPLNLLIDSTGIRFRGDGEWLARKHGGMRRREWRKVHLAMDTETGDIRAVEFTSSRQGDSPLLPELLSQIPGIGQRADISGNMVILGAGLNHWYHMDMSYRGIIQLLVMCGCVGQSGGGWAHYVGQEKLRPQTGWLPLAFTSDWSRPPRHMNGTSFFYAHTDQWRYETMQVTELLSPLAPAGDWSGAMIDYNVRAERMGWLPSAPQLLTNPLDLGRSLHESGCNPGEAVVAGLKSGELALANTDPDNPRNWPRNMFFWRSDVLGASGKGHEYFLKHFVGSLHGVVGTDARDGIQRPQEVVWRDEAPIGKLDLMVNIDFRMSTTSVYSDVVLPTATWYEKHDLNTTDMHPFIHPLTAAVDPSWEARSDWSIFRGLAKKFSEVAPEELRVEHDVVLSPVLHDTPNELAQPYEPKDWSKGECEPVPGMTMPNVQLVERNYPEVFSRFTSLGPDVEKFGNGSKGLIWNAEHEVKQLGDLNGRVPEGPAAGRPKIDTDVDACETILMLAPETNGAVAIKAWDVLTKATGRHHAHLAEGKEEEKIRFRDVAAQPRKIISSPTWSGIESESVCYNAGWTNVHELIPWRTLSGRQQLYQDHHWMRAFGAAFVTWRPPIDTRSVAQALGKLPNGNKEIVLNFLTPHQKWGIHSTYAENLIMLSLNRGGPAVWISEDDARAAGIVDNDWIEAFNVNGALTARAIVSQRIMPGSCIMYHAQEKLVNTVGSEVTGQRGGIHNSVTRINMKPTHMIGGYAQLAYGFNYYGTVGANRDEVVILRKMTDVNRFDKAAEENELSETGTADWGTGQKKEATT